jgi:hypothetical protein
MSTTMKLVTEDGEERIITLSALRHRLKDEESYLQALEDLLRSPGANVELRDGTRARVTDDTADVAVVQRGLLLRAFDVNLIMHVGIPAYATVDAASRSEAAEIVSEVLAQRSPPPPGFRVEVSNDDLEALNSTIEFSLPDRPQFLRPTHVQIEDVRERLLLGRPT